MPGSCVTPDPGSKHGDRVFLDSYQPPDYAVVGLTMVERFDRVTGRHRDRFQRGATPPA
jgi:hypothetical protein